MALDIWIAGVGIILIWKLRKHYSTSKTETNYTKVIKPLYIYKNKTCKSVPIPINGMFNNIPQQYNGIDVPFIISRSKSLPIIFEHKPLSL